MTAPGTPTDRPERRASLPGSFDDLVHQARALADGVLVPAPTRDAATVMLLRDAGRPGDPDLEVFLLRRVASMAFAPRMTVFPGGSVDPRDLDLPAGSWAGPPPESWTGAVRADATLTAALVCAAVRETFEESGVLLAGPSSDEVVADTSGDDWETERQALVDRSLSFAEFLARRGTRLRADLVRPWAHWVTPEVEPRRFDTRFFVAALPSGQRTRDVCGEADDAQWMRPREAFAAVERGELQMLPPTLAALGDLAAYRSVADVMSAADEREIVRVLPRVVPDDEHGVRFILPWDEGYAG